jgi:ABC-type bacteriocin/lantibiotic exporter with double-glycine peptidase domain
LGGTLSTSIVIMIALVVLGVFINGLMQVNQMKLIEKVQQKIFVRYSLEFSDRIPKLNLRSVDSYYLPELVNRFFDTITLQKGISKLLLDIPKATIEILFGLLLLSFYHPIFIFFGLMLIIIVYLILKFTSARGMESSLRASDFKYAVAGWLEEMARVINSFKFARSNALNIKRTDGLLSGYLKQCIIHFRVLQLQYWSLIMFKVLITAAMLIMGVILILDFQLTIGQFIAAEIVILMVIGSVEKMIMSLDTVYDVLTSVEKLSKLTDKPLEKDGNIPLVNEPEGIAVELNNVSFKYNAESVPVLRHISCNIAKNEKVCLMGATGSGKSTLLRLLSGAYNEFEGNIFVNNIPLTNYQLDTLRAQTGILLSTQEIFQGTLLENVTMGNDEISPQNIIHLADKIGLKTFFTELEDGLNTRLDPVGKKLSRNIQLKILLLRALVNHPRLVLLEEPFDGLSEQVQMTIKQYLLTECKNQTIVISSNSEVFAAQCDEVIFMDHGQIKAFGKWNDIKHLIK